MDFNYKLAKFIDFQDEKECARVRGITKEDIDKHPNKDFKIRVIDDPQEFYFDFALDIVGRIEEGAENGRDVVLILPVGPVPQFNIAAKLINHKKLSLKHVHVFNMDEYADEDGNTAPISWSGSFQKAMYDNLFSKIDKDLLPPEKQIYFPTTDKIDSYSKIIEDLGGADACYGGIGWCGHIAFWESHLGHEFGDDLDAYMNAGARCVELHPMTIMQNALHSFGGDWSWVPPKANTIGPKEIMGAKHRSFWLDGYLGGGISWQRYIARLVAHGRVNPLVPGSILQTAKTDYNILGGVADDVEIHMS